MGKPIKLKYSNFLSPFLLVLSEKLSEIYENLLKEIGVMLEI